MTRKFMFSTHDLVKKASYIKGHTMIPTVKFKYTYTYVCICVHMYYELNACVPSQNSCVKVLTPNVTACEERIKVK